MGRFREAALERRVLESMLSAGECQVRFFILPPTHLNMMEQDACHCGTAPSMRNVLAFVKALPHWKEEHKESTILSAINRVAAPWLQFLRNIKHNQWHIRGDDLQYVNCKNGSKAPSFLMRGS